MEYQDLTEVMIGNREVYNGKVVRLQECDVKLPNGRTSVREVVRHPGAVAILAEPTPGKLILVSQYRFAPGEVLVELPAGKLEPGESLVNSAARELAEETGYRARDLQLVYEFYTSPGFADERIALFYANQLSEGDVHLDDDEFVQVSTYERTDLVQMLSQGAIRDAKTIIGVLWWLQFGNKA